MLLRIVIHALPLCCRLESLPVEEADVLEAEIAQGKLKKTVEERINEITNALYLVRNFTMRFVEKQDETPLLAHFNQLAPMVDYNAIASPRCK